MSRPPQFEGDREATLAPSCTVFSAPYRPSALECGVLPTFAQIFVTLQHLLIDFDSFVQHYKLLARRAGTPGHDGTTFGRSREFVTAQCPAWLRFADLRFYTDRTACGDLDPCVDDAAPVAGIGTSERGCQEHSMRECCTQVDIAFNFTRMIMADGFLLLISFG